MIPIKAPTTTAIASFLLGRDAGEPGITPKGHCSPPEKPTGKNWEDVGSFASAIVPGGAPQRGHTLW